jgi:hopene-associated glycosyltransferase HpnB
VLVDLLAVFALAAWLYVLLFTAGSWRTSERLEPRSNAAGDGVTIGLDRVSVLIPARNEAGSIGATLQSLAGQGRGLEVVVIDDQSEDETAATVADTAARLQDSLELKIVEGRPLPAGWGGKLWALEQGLQTATREYCLLLDAEILLEPGMLGALVERADREDRAIVSIMAKLRCESFWERLLVPPFIFFFKLLYPFARVNDPGRRTAAAAGGCVLIRSDVLRSIGGFAAIREALIDDCTLAQRVKRAGHPIWLGLSESVRSRRAYADLGSFRRMVTRTAFTQLRYSIAWLVLVVVLMLAVFVAPIVALASAGMLWGRLAGLGALAAMSAAFWPTVRFYRLPPGWALTLPAAALLFLGMTIESAINYWRGIKARWKGRIYAARP